MADRNEGNWIGKSSSAAESSADAAMSDGLNSRILISEIFITKAKIVTNEFEQIERNWGKGSNHYHSEPWRAFRERDSWELQDKGADRAWRKRWSNRWSRREWSIAFATPKPQAPAFPFDESFARRRWTPRLSVRSKILGGNRSESRFFAKNSINLGGLDENIPVNRWGWSPSSSSWRPERSRRWWGAVRSMASHSAIKENCQRNFCLRSDRTENTRSNSFLYRNFSLREEPIDVVHSEVGQERIEIPCELRLKIKMIKIKQGKKTFDQFSISRFLDRSSTTVWFRFVFTWRIKETASWREDWLKFPAKGLMWSDSASNRSEIESSSLLMSGFSRSKSIENRGTARKHKQRAW